MVAMSAAIATPPTSSPSVPSQGRQESPGGCPADPWVADVRRRSAMSTPWSSEVGARGTRDHAPRVGNHTT